MEAEYKVVLVGDTGVGKTSLIERYYSGTFNEAQHTTVGAAYFRCVIEVSTKESIIINVWDTAGQERFHSLIPLYLRNTAGIIFVFDLSEKPEKSISMINKIYEGIQELITPDVNFILCGNKADLKEDLNSEDITPFKEWAEEHKTQLVFTSAKTGMGVNDLYLEIGTEIYKSLIVNKQEEELVGVDNKDKKRCC